MPLSWAYLFTWSYRLNCEMKNWTLFLSLVVSSLVFKSLFKSVLMLPELVLPHLLDYAVLSPPPGEVLA